MDTLLNCASETFKCVFMLSVSVGSNAPIFTVLPKQFIYRVSAIQNRLIAVKLSDTKRARGFTRFGIWFVLVSCKINTVVWLRRFHYRYTWR